ncbi:MAG: hypothetical protein RMY16_20465 [Nostoc sp. DedQUE12b]|uniref:hypothetical protein n=1 Tax=Nostoc sp. DedQUE12b TaxID=3075398 RepID=UPI002AD4CAD1|nr:hypothetical protein [Nostoc sp. DedQUE12b]MDZ8087915.1 hypothetical protein [Nostoc sp. DedQUE12b]
MTKIDIATKFRLVWLIESFLTICLIFLYYEAMSTTGIDAVPLLYQDSCSDRLIFSSHA